MTKKEILDYVMENPGNTNVSVLGPMVDAVSGVTPTGKITITENGSDIDVAQYAKADVNVSSSGGLSTCQFTYKETGNKSNKPLVPEITDWPEDSIVVSEIVGSGVKTVPLYEERLYVYTGDYMATVTSGEATYSDQTLIIKGDCSVTFS